MNASTLHLQCTAKEWGRVKTDSVTPMISKHNDVLYAKKVPSIGNPALAELAGDLHTLKPIPEDMLGIIRDIHTQIWTIIALADRAKGGILDDSKEITISPLSLIGVKLSENAPHIALTLLHDLERIERIHGIILNVELAIKRMVVNAKLLTLSPSSNKKQINGLFDIIQSTQQELQAHMSNLLLLLETPIAGAEEFHKIQSGVKDSMETLGYFVTEIKEKASSIMSKIEATIQNPPPKQDTKTLSRAYYVMRFIQSIHSIGENAIPNTTACGFTIVNSISEESIVIPRENIYRAIENFIRNAYTHKAKEIEVHLKKEGKKLIIEIYDDGIGMDPERIEKFGTGETGEHKQSSGVGSLESAMKVQMAGGKLKVASYKGKGTVIRMEFPFITTTQ